MIETYRTNSSGLLKELPIHNTKKGWPWNLETDPLVYAESFNWPKISIITPSFNQGQYIEETIRSVLLQNYPNLEYIIIDGGSTDNTVEIIKKYEPWLTYWVSKPDNGQSHAINKGVERARGDIINWLNSDDYYELRALKTVAENFITGIHCVTGRSKIFDEFGVKNYSRGTDIYPQDLIKTIGRARIDQPETFFSKEAWRKVGTLNQDLNFVFDKEWWIRYLLEFDLNSIIKTSSILVNFRHHENSKTISSQHKFNDETLLIYASLANYCSLKHIYKYLLKLSNYREPIKLEITKLPSDQVLLSVINYYLLHTADYMYANNQKDDVRLLLKFINQKYLTSKNIILFNKLRYRNKIPSPLLKLFRNLINSQPIWFL